MRIGSAERLYRKLSGKPDLDPETVKAALSRGVAVVVLDKCADDWTRQAVVNEAKRQARVRSDG